MKKYQSNQKRLSLSTTLPIITALLLVKLVVLGSIYINQNLKAALSNADQSFAQTIVLQPSDNNQNSTLDSNTIQSLLFITPDLTSPPSPMPKTPIPDTSYSYPLE